VSHAPATHLPFPTGFFDIVTASFVIERVADARAALGEWQRVLRPGGVLAIEAFRATALRRPGAKLPRQAKILPLRYGFTPQNLQGLLRETDFELLSGTGLGRLELLGLGSAVVSMCHQTYRGLLRMVGRDATFEVFCRRPQRDHETITRRRAA
jgi:SAM-dependent methyltransferase